MRLHLTALGLKWLSVWLVLMLFGLSFGPSPGQAAVLAVAVAVVSWVGDRALPFAVQGLTRWAIDSGAAALTLWVAQFLWAGAVLTFPLALFAGFVIGSIEIPLHFFLASRFGLRHRDDEKDGIR